MSKNAIDDLENRITASSVADRIVLLSGEPGGCNVTTDEIHTMAVAIYKAEKTLISLCVEDEICGEDLQPIFEALYIEVEDGLAS